jgi:putative MATE family efflux protein
MSINFKKFIGSKEFYKRVIKLSVPVMIQTGISSFVSLLDNLMIGQLNQNAIAAVAVSNQILFILMIALFGGLAGPGIFLAQFFGGNDKEGVQQSFKIKIIFALVIASVFLTTFFIFGNQIIGLFLQDPLTIKLAGDYFFISLIGYIPFTISVIYSSSFRESAESKIPMVTGLAAVFTNFVFNLLLIFGLFFFPRLEVAGAAIATVIARILEAVLLILYAHRQKFMFAEKVYRSLKINIGLLKNVLIKGLPLVTSEILWSGGMSALFLAYSTFGEEVIAAMNINNTISNLFFITFGAMASAIAVFVGGELGANRLDVAKDNAYKMIAFGTLIGIIAGVMLISLSGIIPNLYQVSDFVKELATYFAIVTGFVFGIYSYNASSFFVLRAGGATKATFFFDAIFTWAVQVSFVAALVYLTDLSVYWIFPLSMISDILKAVLGTAFIKSGIWIKNLTIKLE